jgi:hypothetical protein
MMLLNPYDIDMGTSGLIIQAQNREEIYADKLLAFALRPNRIKYCDLWDIIWLHRAGIKARVELIPDKLRDRNCPEKHFLTLFDEREKLLSTMDKIAEEFTQEMRRFLSVEQISAISDQQNFWHFLQNLQRNQLNIAITSLYNNIVKLDICTDSEVRISYNDS